MGSAFPAWPGNSARNELTEEIAIIAPQTTAIDILPDEDVLFRKLTKIKTFQRLIHDNLIKDRDYGVIPGTSKPTLLKPGAEKITSLVQVYEDYVIMDKTVEWESGLFAYDIKCRLFLIGSDPAVQVTEGVGECNSNESKYRYRWIFSSEAEAMGYTEEQRHALKNRTIKTKNGPATQYRINNEDRADQKNTILKIAKKRALVDAALSVASLSDLFTQDLDEMGGSANTETASSTPSQQEHFCQEHGVAFFKTEKMRSYAHKTDNGWHNMPNAPAEPPSQPAETSNGEKGVDPRVVEFLRTLSDAGYGGQRVEQALGMRAVDWLKANPPVPRSAGDKLKKITEAVVQVEADNEWGREQEEEEDLATGRSLEGVNEGTEPWEPKQQTTPEGLPVVPTDEPEDEDAKPNWFNDFHFGCCFRVHDGLFQ